MQLYVGSDNLISLGNPKTGTGGLCNSLPPPGYVDNAVVVGVILNTLDVPVPGSTFTLNYVAASNGIYSGQVAATVAATLVRYAPYQVQVTATVGGLTYIMRLALPADYAKGNSGCC